MKLFILYQIEVAICLSVFYLFYKLLLSKDAHHQLKRGYIIISSLCAFLIPGLTFNLSPETSVATVPVTYLNQITQPFSSLSPPSAIINTFDSWQVLFWIWVIGFMVMTGRLIFSLLQVHKILREAPVATDKSFKITSNKVLSFSFFKSIVINVEHYRSPAIKYILAHEQAHARQLHTLDILYIELLKAWQWFSPFSWSLAKESVLNLEYIADNNVISKYNDTREYQLAIVQYSHHTSNKLLRTEFSKSNLKNRIAMMNQTNLQKNRIVRYLLLLPVILALLMSFSLKIDSANLRSELTNVLPLVSKTGVIAREQIPPAKINTKAENDGAPARDASKKVLTPLSNQHMSAKAKDVAQVKVKSETISADISQPGKDTPKLTQDTTRTITGRVTSQDGKAEAGVNVIIRGTSKGTVTAGDGSFVLNVGPSQTELLIASPDNRVEVVNISENDEFVIILKPNQTENILTIDSNENVIQPDSTLVVNVDTGLNQPMYILDNKHVDNNILRKINPNDIDNITVLKGKSATSLYGEKAKDGVIIIETKKKFRKK